MKPDSLVAQELPSPSLFNYAISVAMLFCKVAIQIIKETGIFWITSADLVAKSRDNLPSWAPNWTEGFISPGLQSAVWRTRLCHNTSDLMFSIQRDSTTGEWRIAILPTWPYCST